MKHYIDKDKVLTEIEKAIDELAPSHDSQCPWEDGYYCGLYKTENIIDTLEVKEVDLKEEIDNYLDNNFYISETWGIFSEKTENEINRSDLEDIAKHFFELGVNASNPLTWKDIDLILDITDQIANDDSMEEKLNNMSQEKYCTEVLKQFKTQKGEEV